MKLCAKQGLYVWIRIGPWDHGEVRNGGLPDWVLAKSTPRQNDPAYLKVRDVAQDANGQIWIGTDEGLFRLAGKRIERVDGKGEIKPLAVHAIHEDREKRLWVGGSQLLEIAGAAVTEYSLEGAASENRVKSIEETADGTIWVGTVSGLQRMIPDTRSNRAFKKVHEVDGTVRFLRETSDGRLWIGTIGHGLEIYVGVASIVNARQDMTVVAQTGTGEEAVRLYHQHKPDVTLM